ncbi:aminoglycoside phosphotransferase family protein [Cytobacillus solani]|uniref:aminoglycoside phosphotransferase family protein n=1 Tax=Cytobacillus solani TaxID=1637975 RepID=UPI002079F041|nr:aminoglycoside phosphotransferase family protein [Cytobacillus solani]USK53158.1 aminoglycoside phosphotransferase family protein [Cytobacillus solani]
MLPTENLMIIKKTYPHLEINEVRINNNGWDNDILIINDEIVFRFPKSEHLITKVIDEMKILDHLAVIEPIIKIPKYEPVFNENKLIGVKYAFLKGKSLSEYTDCQLNEEPENAKLMADFLTKLHSIDISVMNDTNLTAIHTLHYWENLYSLVKQVVFPFLNTYQQSEISEVFISFINNYSSLSYKKTLIHGDLTPSNIIFNKTINRIDGIIDFTDAQFGDPAFDFAGLYWTFGPDFTQKVLSWYNNTECADLIFNRVRTFYGLQPVFHELLHVIKNKQKMNWESALDRFSQLKSLI